MKHRSTYKDSPLCSKSQERVYNKAISHKQRLHLHIYIFKYRPREAVMPLMDFTEWFPVSHFKEGVKCHYVKIVLLFRLHKESLDSQKWAELLTLRGLQLCPVNPGTCRGGTAQDTEKGIWTSAFLPPQTEQTLNLKRCRLFFILNWE